MILKDMFQERLFYNYLEQYSLGKKQKQAKASKKNRR
jgi:hypothetical protein